ncbi:hypothetical protein JCM16358_08440 [Halanaerocella petrolearia]
MIKDFQINDIIDYSLNYSLEASFLFKSTFFLQVSGIIYLITLCYLFYDCDEVWIVTTTNKLSNDVNKTATILGVEIVNRRTLNQYLVDIGFCQQSEKRKVKNSEPEKKDTNKQTKIVGEICPKCGSKMEIEEGKYGQFWGCSQFPDCKETVSIKE